MSELVNFRGEVVDPEGAAGTAGTYVATVGGRVRRARERKGITRRALSELSGVSQRHLAQLENGGGNVSIALLKRIADALDHRIEWLVGEENPWDSDVAVFAERYRSASRADRQRVLQILDPSVQSERRARRICLIGLRGAGKSTLGIRLGRRLGLPFVELDAEIAEQGGMPVTELTALYGLEGYRRLEAQAIRRVVALYSDLVLEVAGGIVSEPETYHYLLQNFHTIWLKASPEEHMMRVRGQGDERPMAGNPQAMDELRSILTSREALYARAEATVDTSGRTPAESLQALTETVNSLSFG